VVLVLRPGTSWFLSELRSCRSLARDHRGGFSLDVEEGFAADVHGDPARSSA
jgi:hypothetical protein